jgi:cyclic lactone autoinducer peptide
MKKIAKSLKKFVIKHGNAIACCAFAFVAFTSNSSSMVLFHEPEEPAGLDKFKKFNR